MEQQSLGLSMVSLITNHTVTNRPNSIARVLTLSTTLAKTQIGETSVQLNQGVSPIYLLYIGLL